MDIARSSIRTASLARFHLVKPFRWLGETGFDCVLQRGETQRVALMSWKLVTASWKSLR